MVLGKAGQRLSKNMKEIKEERQLLCPLAISAIQAEQAQRASCLGGFIGHSLDKLE
jgi:hypothetical protein